jgi:hypothetical protein
LLTFLPSRGVDCKPHNAFSPTHTDRTNTGSSTRQRLSAQQQQAGREASWLKEARKVKRVLKETEKCETRSKGGKVKTNLVKKDFEKTNKMIGATAD